MTFLHWHFPVTITENRIVATYGKKNLPNVEEDPPVVSTGVEAFCDCGARLIIHDDKELAERFTVLEGGE